MSLPITLKVFGGFMAGTPYAYYTADSADSSGLYSETAANPSEYAPDTIMHDLSAYGPRNQSISITRGVTQLVSQPGFVSNAGTFSCALDNRTRAFDPANLSGPFVEGGVSQVKISAPVQLIVSYGGTDYTLFTGTADDWPQSYPSLGVDQVVQLRATDGQKTFANASLGVGSGDEGILKPAVTRRKELSGARISAIASLTGWTGPTSVSTGTIFCGPLAQQSLNSWFHMTEVAALEFADLYISSDGTLTYRDRTAITTDTRSSVSQATFGDQPGELKFVDLTMATPVIMNDIIVKYRDDGSFVNLHNGFSQQEPWGRISGNVDIANLNCFRADAMQVAVWMMNAYAFPSTTFSTLKFSPSRDDANLWPQAFGRELGDRITVKRTPQGGGDRIIRDMYIRGIQHTYGNEQWLTTFTLQDVQDV